MTGTNLKATRQRLPNRRGSVTFTLQAGGLNFTATANQLQRVANLTPWLANSCKKGL
jgi:hypothetical protein